MQPVHLLDGVIYSRDEGGVGNGVLGGAVTIVVGIGEGGDVENSPALLVLDSDLYLDAQTMIKTRTMSSAKDCKEDQRIHLSYVIIMSSTIVKVNSCTSLTKKR